MMMFGFQKQIYISNVTQDRVVGLTQKQSGLVCVCHSFMLTRIKIKSYDDAKYH